MSYSGLHKRHLLGAFGMALKGLTIRGIHNNSNPCKIEIDKVVFPSLSRPNQILTNKYQTFPCIWFSVVFCSKMKNWTNAMKRIDFPGRSLIESWWQKSLIIFGLVVYCCSVVSTKQFLIEPYRPTNKSPTSA